MNERLGLASSIDHSDAAGIQLEQQCRWTLTLN